MAQGQFLVRLLNGSTRCVRFSDPKVCCEDLKSRVFEIEGIPTGLQRIVTGTREIQDGELIEGNVGTLSVLLRLRGGKGGFGSLLRASKSRQKKTNNFDACRDMSGRRLRHVNAEKKLKEWQEEAPLRQLETTAMEFLTKTSKKMDSEATTAAELKRFREQAEQKAAEVQEAVLDGLRRGNKRKKNGTDGNKVDKKAKKIAVDSEEDVPSAEPSSSKQNVEGGEEENEKAENIETELSIPVPQKEAEAQHAASPQKKQPLASVPVPEEIQADTKPEVQPAKPEEPVAELKLQDFESAKDLEALGLERLKSELQQRGLKCGGSLTERAARLFLLKSTPLEKLDKKHFAAKPKSCK